MYILVCRRFRGASPACPTPVTGRSASFRLRFRFVRAWRACGRGEAAWVCVGRLLSLSLGLLGASFHVLCRRLGGDFLCTGAWVLLAFVCFFLCRASFIMSKTMGFKTLRRHMLNIHMGFKRYHLKTRAYSIELMPTTFKTRADSSNLLLSL